MISWKTKTLKEWQKIIAEIKELSTISVRRLIRGENLQLLCFCDALGKAYATAIYLKASYEGKIDVNLLFKIDNCTEAEDVSTATRISGIVNCYEKLQVYIKRTKI